MTSKHRITVNLEDDEYEALQRIAEGDERSLAWVARRAICDFLDQRERDDAPLFARGDAERSDLRATAK